MDAIRPSTPHMRVALKAAIRRALDLAGGGDSFANATRVDAPRLSRYASANAAEHMPLDVALDLDLDIGRPVVLAALAAQQGCSVVPGPAVAGPPDAALGAALLRETAEVAAALMEALADGAIDRAERRRLLKEIDEASALLTRLRHALEGQG